MDTKTERFGMVLSPADKEILQKLAEHEQLPAAAVVRRLIWDAAKKSGQPEKREVKA